jgi:hypothetical protein
VQGDIASEGLVGLHGQLRHGSLDPGTFVGDVLDDRGNQDSGDQQ